MTVIWDWSGCPGSFGEFVGDLQLQRSLIGNGSSWVGGREGGVGSSGMLSAGLSTGGPSGS